MSTPAGKKLKSEDFFDIPGLKPKPPRILVIHPSKFNAKAFVEDPGSISILPNSWNDDPATKFDLSPFYIGPCKLYGGHVSHTMENGWHFSKVFPRHVGPDGNPTTDYFNWATEGWSRKRAAVEMLSVTEKPAYFWWDGQKLDKAEARKRIYVPLYAELVVKTKSFDFLHTHWLLLKKKGFGTLYIFEADSYDYTGKTLSDVLNDPTEAMGHGFVLAMLLLNDPALNQCYLRRATLDFIK